MQEILYILAEGKGKATQTDPNVMHRTARRACSYFRHLSDFSGYALPEPSMWPEAAKNYHDTHILIDFMVTSYRVLCALDD